MTGARQSTGGKGTDATDLWRHDGRGARNCSLVCGLRTNDLDRQEGSRSWEDGRRLLLELLGLAATGLTGTQIVGYADPHY
eukprot:3255989-Rhodomonas_salina.1